MWKKRVRLSVIRGLALVSVDFLRGELRCVVSGVEELQGEV
jgi:hypothetical protein